MTKFTPIDVKHLISDLQIYSGNIQEITNICGPHKHNSSIQGTIRTGWDEFHFHATPMFCDDKKWTVHLKNPVVALQKGKGLLTPLTFPKIHKDSDLEERYRIANLIYSTYDSNSAMCETQRLRQQERELGYDRLPTYHHVLTAIISDYRSYKIRQKRPRRQTGDWNTWKELVEFLQKQLDVIPFESKATDDLGDSQLHATRVELSLHEFCRKFEWIEMSPAVRFDVRQRLSLAIRIAELFHHSQLGSTLPAFPVPRSNSEEILKLLLVGVWHALIRKPSRPCL